MDGSMMFQSGTSSSCLFFILYLNMIHVYFIMYSS